MKVLITGASGFIGQHLLKALRKNQELQLFAPSPEELDLRHPQAPAKTLATQKWDAVIHLAGMSHVVECENNRDQALAINVEGTKALLQLLLEQGHPCHFVLASTAQIYRAPAGEEITEGVVFDEERPLMPQNFYAQTKRMAEEAVFVASQKGLRATVLRLFNHTHKTQAPSFFLPHIYSQLLSGNPKIPVGNLDLERDIGSVRDLIRAFELILKVADWNFEIFNVCTGYPKNLRRLVQLLRTRMQATAEFVDDPSRHRPGEALRLVGSHKKLSARTGWQPRVLNEEQLIEDFLCE